MGETLTGQISRDVHDSIITLHESVTLRDWRTSGFTPSDIFKNVFSLNSDAPKILCEVLGDLPPQDLALFEDALRKPGARNHLKCTQKLLGQIDHFWAEQRERMKITQSLSSDPVEIEVRKLPSSARALTSLDLNPGEYALVFEGGPDRIRTEEILQTLQKAGAKAIFLSPGQDARDEILMTEHMAQTGQIVGSQSLKAKDLTAIPTQNAQAEISEGDHIIRYITGRNTHLFSFPLATNLDDPSYAPLEEYLKNQRLVLVRPDLDSEDWKTLDPAALLAQVCLQLAKSPKGIISFHNRLEQTALALPGILQDIASHHRKLVVFTH
jgi:peptidoglycan/xylan/chitin deacetylase (PgdA/CDA1 family)